MTTLIEAIVVGVPAHDEAGSIEACLGSLTIAATQVDVPVTVVVAADACSDQTVPVARRAAKAAGGLAIEVITTAHRSAGAARSSAIDAGLRSTRGHPQVWVASTDADTIVDPTWLAVHLAWARRGVDAVAGLVDVAWQSDDHDLAQRYKRSIAGRGTAMGHRHVHGANLGLRADWWRRVGGCGNAPSGEDHELWRRLRSAGAVVLGVDDLRVSTSARRVGRAPEGFAAYLGTLLSEAGVR